MVVDQLTARAVEGVREEALRERYPDRVRDALPERTRRDLDARRMPALGVTRSPRAPLTEAAQVIEREVEAREVKQRVLQNAGVPARQYEAVAMLPMGVGWIGAQEALEQRVAKRRERHRRPRVARVRALHRIHREPADRVYRQPPKLALGHHARS